MTTIRAYDKEAATDALTTIDGHFQDVQDGVPMPIPKGQGSPLRIDVSIHIPDGGTYTRTLTGDEYHQGLAGLLDRQIGGYGFNVMLNENFISADGQDGMKLTLIYAPPGYSVDDLLEESRNLPPLEEWEESLREAA
jgi:hypothetical protein